MKPRSTRVDSARWGPSLVVAAFVLGAGATGLLVSGAFVRAEGARWSAVSVELEARRRAVTRLRERFRDPSDPREEALWASLGSLTEPIEAPRSTPWPWTALAVLGWAGAAGWWMRARWARPLARIGRAVEAAEAPAAEGAPAVRALAHGLRGCLAAEEDRRARAASDWRAGFEQLVGRGDGRALPSEIAARVEAAKSHRADEEQTHRAAWLQLSGTLEESRQAAKALTRAADVAAQRWQTAAIAADHAHRRLARLEPELATQRAEADERARALRESVSSLQHGLTRASRRAEELADQANRAIDAAAGEQARMARVARGGRATPMEAPPLDRWAEELDETARALRDVVESLGSPPAPAHRAHSTTFEQDALTGLIDASVAARDAVEAAGPLVAGVRAWAEVHAESFRMAPSSVGPDERPEPDLERALSALEAEATAAEARIEASARRAERLLEIVRG